MYRSKIAPPPIFPSPFAFFSFGNCFFAQAGDVCLWCHSSGPHQRRGNGFRTLRLREIFLRGRPWLAWLTVEMFSWCGFQD